MSNIDLVHAAYVQRKVEEDAKKYWLPVINEEVEKIKGYKESDQTIPSNQYKTIKNIIPLEKDLDKLLKVYRRI
ncbi:hypothetical protein POG14_05170 [Clostridium paraputrificum]|uniref:hypothetical protein n=1 Tax=Clostridium paraputrificum TaxID=29363 RepID=UPI00189A7DCA|nr:hypothetical protein [Clostridium paraputrificum]MDC0801566.1 hypothetical protein [Clostridium paraputrificum]